jgi:hypothetical protein
MTTKGIVMKQRFILFRRAGVYYYEDTTTGQQLSLRTKDEAEAHTLLHSKNEAHRQPVLNLRIARTYLTATDPEVARRTSDYEGVNVESVMLLYICSPYMLLETARA